MTKLGLVVVTILMLLIGMFAWLDDRHNAHLLRMFEQCLADRQPEYVCYHHVYGGQR